jgi:hypothetical protein
MGYVGHRHWLDDPEAERDERIGEHEGYIDLLDLASGQYVNGGLWWGQVLERLGAEQDPAKSAGFHLVPRCYCDEVWCRGEKWAGGRYEIVRDARGEIDHDASDAAAIEEWRGHVDGLRQELDEMHIRAMVRRGVGLVVLEEFRKLPPLARLSAVRSARAALDGVELDAVVEARRDKESWAAIGSGLGTTRQAARERFLAHDPRRGDESES